MALQRLRESIDLPRSYYQELTEVPENLKESFKAVSANKKLQESESVTSLIKAAEKLRESSNDKAIFDKIISKLKEESDFVVKEKSDNISHLMTETLAKLYVEQKLYSKAIKAYQILSEKHPEKEAHFAEQINYVKDLRQNK